jgi:hypothetical protein
VAQQLGNYLNLTFRRGNQDRTIEGSVPPLRPPAWKPSASLQADSTPVIVPVAHPIGPAPIESLMVPTRKAKNPARTWGGTVTEGYRGRG